MVRKTRESNDTKVKISTVYIEITKQVPQHPHDRLAEEVNEWKSKLNEAVDEILLTNVIPQYLRQRLRRRRIELNAKISFMNKIPQHPRDRPSQKVKELIKAAKAIFVTKKESSKRQTCMKSKGIK